MCSCVTDFVIAWLTGMENWLFVATTWFLTCATNVFSAAADIYYDWFVLLLLLMFVLSMDCLWYSIVWCLEELFCQDFPKGEIVVPFRLESLCKTTWSVQSILVQKGHMWEKMTKHECNIYPLFSRPILCFWSEILVGIQSDLLLFFTNAFVWFV